MYSRCRATVPQAVHLRQAMDHRKWKTTWLTHCLATCLLTATVCQATIESFASQYREPQFNITWIMIVGKLFHYYSLLVLHWITDLAGQDISKASEHSDHTETSNPWTTTEILKLNSNQQNKTLTRNIYIHFCKMKVLSSKKHESMLNWIYIGVLQLKSSLHAHLYKCLQQIVTY